MSCFNFRAVWLGLSSSITKYCYFHSTCVKLSPLIPSLSLLRHTFMNVIFDNNAANDWPHFLQLVN